ncbi:unnamed protein product, partial [Ectocarpus sp. 12 AP-2014]
PKRGRRRRRATTEVPCLLDPRSSIDEHASSTNSRKRAIRGRGPATPERQYHPGISSPARQAIHPGTPPPHHQEPD